jgi:hypothetical protein
MLDSCCCSPIHSHPRASEILYVLEGQLYVGFVDTNSEAFHSASYRLVKKLTECPSLL